MELLNIGIPEMKIANLFEDMDILKNVQELANSIIEKDVKLEQNQNEKLRKLINNKFAEKRIEI